MLDQPPFAQKPQPGATNQQVVPAGGEDIDAIPEQQATEEEQHIYKQYMSEAYKVMADEEAFPNLEKMIEQDPVVAMADATVAIIEKVEDTLGPVEDTDILLGMAEEIVPALAELAEEKGADIPEEKLEEVLSQAAGDWAKAHPDRVDAEAMQAMGESSTQTLQAAQQQQSAGQPAAQQQGVV